MHHADTTAGLVDVRFGLIEVLFAGRAVSRGETEGNGVVSSTDEVILAEAVLEVDILEGDLVGSEGCIPTEVPVLTVVCLEANAHITEADTIIHRTIELLCSIVLRIGSCIK